MNFSDGEWRSLIDNATIRAARLGGASPVDTDQLDVTRLQPPDSVVYQLRTPIEDVSDGDPVTTWPAGIGSPDGQNGTDLAYSEGAFGDRDAVSSNSSDASLNIGSDSVNVIGDSTFAWAICLQTTNSEWGMGYRADDPERSEVSMRYEDGTVEFAVIGAETDNDLTVIRETSIFADIELDDGTPRAIVWNRDFSDSGTGWEIWAGEQGGEISELETEIDSGFEDADDFFAPADTDDDMFLWKVPFEPNMEGSISHFELADDILSPTEISGFHSRAFL